MKHLHCPCGYFYEGASSSSSGKMPCPRCHRENLDIFDATLDPRSGRFVCRSRSCLGEQIPPQSSPTIPPDSFRQDLQFGSPSSFLLSDATLFHLHCSFCSRIFEIDDPSDVPGPVACYACHKGPLSGPFPVGDLARGTCGFAGCGRAVAAPSSPTDVVPAGSLVPSVGEEFPYRANEISYRVMEDELSDQNTWSVFRVGQQPPLKAQLFWKYWVPFEYFHSRFLRKGIIVIGTKALEAFLNTLVGAAEGAALGGGIGAGTGAIKGALTSVVTATAGEPIKQGTEKVVRAQKLNKLVYATGLEQFMLPVWLGYDESNYPATLPDHASWQIFKRRLYFKPPKSGGLNQRMIMCPKILHAFQVTSDEALRWKLIWEASSMWPMLDYIYFNDIFLLSAGSFDVNALSDDMEPDLPALEGRIEPYVRNTCRAARFYYLSRNFFLDEFFEYTLPQMEVQTLHTFQFIKNEFAALKESFELKETVSDKKSETRRSPARPKEDKHSIEMSALEEEFISLSELNNLKSLFDILHRLRQSALEVGAYDEGEGFCHYEIKILLEKLVQRYRESIGRSRYQNKIFFEYIKELTAAILVKAGTTSSELASYLQGDVQVISKSHGLTKLVHHKTASKSSTSHTAAELIPNLDVGIQVGFSALQKIVSEGTDGLRKIIDAEKKMKVFDAVEIMGHIAGFLRLSCGTANFIMQISAQGALIDAVAQTTSPAIANIFSGSSPFSIFGTALSNILTKELKLYGLHKMDVEVLKVVDDYIEEASIEEHPKSLSGLKWSDKKTVRMRRYDPQSADSKVLYRYFPRVLRHLFIASKPLPEIQVLVQNIRKTYGSKDAIKHKEAQLIVDLQMQVSPLAGFGPGSGIAVSRMAELASHSGKHLVQEAYDKDCKTVIDELYKLYLFIFYARKYRFLIETAREEFVFREDLQDILNSQPRDPNDVRSTLYEEILRDRSRNYGPGVDTPSTVRSHESSPPAVPPVPSSSAQPSSSPHLDAEAIAHGYDSTAAQDIVMKEEGGYKNHFCVKCRAKVDFNLVYVNGVEGIMCPRCGGVGLRGG